MSEKKIYESPVVDITLFEVQDIITTSEGGNGIELPDHNWE